MRGKLDKLANVAVIGNGTLAHAQDFDQTQGKGLRSLVDTRKQTYKALGFRHGVRYTLGPASLARGMDAMSRGFRQVQTQGDPFQQGGTLVVAAGGRPVLFQRARFAGDHASLEEILAAATMAAAAG
ncbi:MAG TPA: AhpC/TSA family protein [Candidatus Dormibacteraeota bacterium]|nr:AhpC/TSA family protein [Candidatus Dormibacteraeota bacterium]